MNKKRPVGIIIGWIRPKKLNLGKSSKINCLPFFNYFRVINLEKFPEHQSFFSFFKTLESEVSVVHLIFLQSRVLRKSNTKLLKHFQFFFNHWQMELSYYISEKKKGFFAFTAKDKGPQAQRNILIEIEISIVGALLALPAPWKKEREEGKRAKCEKMCEDGRRWEDGGRCKDVGRCEDVRRCEKMLEDVRHEKTRRCEHMWRSGKM